jgi:hypothetical protein
MLWKLWIIFSNVIFQIKEQLEELWDRDSDTKKANPREDPLTIIVIIVKREKDSRVEFIWLIRRNNDIKNNSKLRSIVRMFFRHQQSLNILNQIIILIKIYQFLHPK